MPRLGESLSAKHGLGRRNGPKLPDHLLPSPASHGMLPPKKEETGLGLGARPLVFTSHRSLFAKQIGGTYRSTLQETPNSDTRHQGLRERLLPSGPVSLSAPSPPGARGPGGQLPLPTPSDHAALPAAQGAAGDGADRHRGPSRGPDR